MKVKKVLVIGYTKSGLEFKTAIHYSICRDVNLSDGFSGIGVETFCSTDKLKDNINNVEYYPFSKMDNDFLKSFDIIFFVREYFNRVFRKSKILEKIVHDRKNKLIKKPIVCVRMGGHSWALKEGYNINQLYSIPDLFFMQSRGAAEHMKSVLGGDHEDKINYFRMAVPKKLPSPEECPFEKSKHNLIYMGRLRHHPLKLDLIIDIMNNLGKDYKLVILPGTFSKPNFKGRNKFGPENEKNFKWLENYFSKAPNIDLHKPVNWGNHWNYLQHSDIGIDFSPHAKIIPHIADNTKLFEYLACGLPVVSELGSGNIDLIRKADGGIVINGKGNCKNYTEAIKKAVVVNFDREMISKVTIENNNWESRARFIIDFVEKRF